MTKPEIGQLFENKFDCYADTESGDEMAMTKSRFIEVVSKIVGDKEEKSLPIIEGWIDVNSNLGLFDMSARNNCFCKFDDGTECSYDDDHPIAIMTHFKIK